MNAPKKDLDWGNLGFSYVQTELRFSARWRDGVWGEGELVSSAEMQVHEGSTVLHYAQSCFEGLKAQTAVEWRHFALSPGSQLCPDGADHAAAAHATGARKFVYARDTRNRAGECRMGAALWFWRKPLHSALLGGHWRKSGFTAGTRV